KHGIKCANDGAFGLQNVEASFNDNAVDPALDEGNHLRLVRVVKLVERDGDLGVLERWLFGSGADGPEDKSWPGWRAELPGDFLGDSHATSTELLALIGNAEFGENMAAAIEGVCFDRVAAGGQKARVNLANPLRVRMGDNVAEV